MVMLAAGDGIQSLSALASGQGISEAYLEQLFRSLKQAGLVVSVRGAGGGYSLGMPAKDISALHIINALEGNSAVSECVSGGGEPCERACVCAARPLFLELQSKINGVLDGTNLAELAAKFNRQNARLPHKIKLSDKNHCRPERVKDAK
jgi:Rrf2 family protein